MKMKPPSGPKKQTQSCQACVVCEGVAGLIKGQNRLPKNPATPLFSPASIIAQHQLASGYEYFSLN